MLEDTRDKKFGSKRKHATGATTMTESLASVLLK
jgi:hypothetical protein